MRAGLDLLPTWALEQKAIANRQVIAATPGAWPPGSRWLACIRRPDWPGWSATRSSKELVAQQSAAAENRPRSHDGKRNEDSNSLRPSPPGEIRSSRGSGPRSVSVLAAPTVAVAVQVELVGTVHPDCACMQLGPLPEPPAQS